MHACMHACRFFEDYKKLEKKEVKVEGFDGPDVAKEIVRNSTIAYKNLGEQKRRAF